MLSEQSYLTAIYVYTGAAGLILLYLMWWASRHMSWSWVVFLVAVSAALLLTPAYPREGVGTLAPALVVFVFQFLTSGADSAMHALRPLGLMLALALTLFLLLRLTVGRAAPSRPAVKKRPESG